MIAHMFIIRSDADLSTLFRKTVEKTTGLCYTKANIIGRMQP